MTSQDQDDSLIRLETEIKDAEKQNALLKLNWIKIPFLKEISKVQAAKNPNLNFTIDESFQGSTPDVASDEVQNIEIPEDDTLDVTKVKRKTSKPQKRVPKVAKNKKETLRKETGQFKCQICGKKYSSKKWLDKHLKLHQNPGLFKCETCGLNFTTKGTLERHLKRHDENREKNFTCNQCEYKSDRKENLKSHQRTHENKTASEKKTTIKCQECPSVFGSESGYNGHIYAKHAIVCDACGSKSKNKSAFQNHFNRIHRH